MQNTNETENLAVPKPSFWLIRISVLKRLKPKALRKSQKAHQYCLVNVIAIQSPATRAISLLSAFSGFSSITRLLIDMRDYTYFGVIYAKIVT